MVFFSTEKFSHYNSGANGKTIKKSNHEKYGNVLYVDGSARASVGANWGAAISYFGKGKNPTGSLADGGGNFKTDTATGRFPTQDDASVVSTSGTSVAVAD